MGENLWDTGVGEELFDMTTKAWPIKENLKSRPLPSLKCFSLQKTMLSMERQLHVGRNICKSISDKGLAYRIHKELSNSTFKNIPIRKLAKKSM